MHPDWDNNARKPMPIGMPAKSQHANAVAICQYIAVFRQPMPNSIA